MKYLFRSRVKWEVFKGAPKIQNVSSFCKRQNEPS